MNITSDDIRYLLILLDRERQHIERNIEAFPSDKNLFSSELSLISSIEARLQDELNKE